MQETNLLAPQKDGEEDRDLLFPYTSVFVMVDLPQAYGYMSRREYLFARDSHVSAAEVLEGGCPG